jgi:hypothetical protein
MGANERQVAGSHYASDLQHWDVCEDHGIGYLESAATKYVTRAYKKNGAEDVEKAIHYTEKLLEKFKAGTRGPRGQVPYDVHAEFCEKNGMDTLQFDCLWELWSWDSEQDLTHALACLQELQEKVLASPPTQTLEETTKKVLGALGNASMQDGLTVLTNVMGHIVVHQSKGIPSQMKKISADLLEAVRISAIQKINADDERRRRG